MSKPVILLVEDEEDLLEIMAFAIGRAQPGHAVVPVSSAVAAMAVIEGLGAEGRVLAMAMVDHMLGGASGMAVVRRIHELYPGTPMVMLTGQATPDVEERARAAGVRVLWKPMRLKQIVSEVAAALGEGGG